MEICTCKFFRLEIFTRPTCSCSFSVFENIYLCLSMPNCTQNHVATYTNSKLLLIFLVKFQNSLPLFTNFVQKTTWNQTRGMWSKSLRIWQKILCIWWRFCFLWLQEAVGLACFSHWALLWYSCGWSPFPLRRMPQKNCRDNKIPWKRKNYLMHW